MKKKLLLALAFLLGMGVLSFAGCGLVLDKPSPKGPIVLEAWPSDGVTDRVTLRLTNRLKQPIEVVSPEAFLDVEADFPSENASMPVSIPSSSVEVRPGEQIEMTVNLADYLKVYDVTEIGTHRVRLDYHVWSTDGMDVQIGQTYVWVFVAGGRIVRAVR